MRPRTQISMLAGLVLTVATAAAQTQRPMLYELQEGSTFQRGCFPPCLCPIWLELPVRGTFKLVPADPIIWFDVYDVLDMDWIVEGANPDFRITGLGGYQIGGNPALMNQLEADLRVGDEPVEHLDSGLIIGGFTFPAIDIVISINGIWCYDTVIHVIAEPVGPICLGDINGDGRTNLDDLGILLADFGCAPPGPCEGDLDGDGRTDLTDLGILLADFGCAP